MRWLNWFWDVLQFLGLSNKAGKILFLGLDNAGKTTLLGKLATGQLHVHRPTYHPNVEELHLGGIKLKTIDLGGHAEARRLWRDYFTKVNGVVFVVDAALPERITEAKQELNLLLQSEELAETPFVILGNKIDLPGALSEERLATSLGVQGMLTGKGAKVPQSTGTRPMEIFMSSVIKQSGYGDAFRWLSQYLN